MFERTMAKVASHATPTDDKVLAQQVRRALEDIKPLCDLGSPLHIQVNDGAVTLSGVVASHLRKVQIVQAVCSVPGVQQVNDRLWV